MRIWILVALARTAVMFPVTASGSASAEFPFEFRDGLIWVSVQAGHPGQPMKFLLDSGAGVSVVNLDAAHRLGLKLGRRVGVRGVQARSSGFWPEQLAAAAGTVSLPKEVLCMDLGELSSACSCPVDGLIGADFFRNREVQIDFSARRIRLLEPGDASTRNSTALPLRAVHEAFLVPVRVDRGKTQWMRLDTACAGALHWVAPNHPSSKQDFRIAVALSRISVPMTESAVQLGAAQFESVPTGLYQQPIFPGEDGLLGNGLLSRFKVVTVDARSGRLWLQ